MKNICVITGGGSGMGLATARLMGKDHDIIICGRTVKKLDTAVLELQQQGFRQVDEIASLFAYCASARAGYLTGVDILCDGGLVASGVNPMKKYNWNCQY
ncbi:SDR family NAD(P)-dependent oxidoreductase [Acetobacterium paludosum]|uniref:SDR family NAD(P)-dependent oxidoreductase n=1 Tax=Acetobacterium paludosum TaxID=52693 RepID=A0A923KVI1_9FIRM|nr:SDR family NAD(P)-dependent oxidoreductase [Acetobacterium paludosum]MBC3887495.1 SDR family NAD(P)-dependent oxidoreductase [Acetobacterium paludosum]